jgi:hypothetical protein
MRDVAFATAGDQQLHTRLLIPLKQNDLRTKRCRAPGSDDSCRAATNNEKGL